MNWAFLYLGYLINVIGRARKVAKSGTNPLNAVAPLLWRWRWALLIRGCGVGAAFLLLQYAPGIIGSMFGSPNLNLPKQLFHPVTMIPLGFFFDALLDRWLESHPTFKSEVPTYNAPTTAAPPYQEPSKP